MAVAAEGETTQMKRSGRLDLSWASSDELFGILQVIAAAAKNSLLK